MSATITVSDACPSWCTLGEGHDRTDVERYHEGPSFGPFRTMCTTVHPEDREARGPLTPPLLWVDERRSEFSDGTTLEIATVEGAARFATWAAEAAAWLVTARAEYDALSGGAR